MLRSMTAFARSECPTPWGQMHCELRAVNNRYLEVGVRLGEDLRNLEPLIREQLKARLKRGKVDCTVRIQPVEGESGELALDMDQVMRLARAAESIRARVASARALGVVDLLRWPGVIRTAPPAREALTEAVQTLLTRAIDDLIAGREREGRTIHEAIEERCEQIAGLAEQVRSALPEALAEARERLHRRLEEVRDKLSAERLEQEIVIAAQKADVAEELERLQAHVDEVRRVVAEEDPAGRRLDFLMQELNREANTLGAKSASLATTRHSVAIKVLIEQMREQVQNVE